VEINSYNVSSSTNTSGLTVKKEGSSLGMDDFLNLLVSQNDKSGFNEPYGKHRVCFSTRSVFIIAGYDWFNRNYLTISSNILLLEKM